MIRSLIGCGLLLIGMEVTAQEKNAAEEEVSFELGSGLNFRFNDGAYEFKLGGMIQPSIAYEQVEDEDADYFMNSKRTYFNFSGKAVEEKVSFLIQTDFSLNEPLLDAWIAYHATDRFNITFGQKQTIGNNREMMVMETFLQFPNRSLLSTALSNTGREFGLFLDYTLGNDKLVVVPQLAVTSGDGRNSFGTDSRDVDYGGFKYAGRLDLYVLGKFSEGNEDFIADLKHEEEPKVLLGAAASYNDGASNAVGEGHGDFFLYDADGDEQQPDYSQLYFDLLMKYKGFSILGEYSLATAGNLENTFVDVTGNSPLLSGTIAQYLSLGSAMNVQIGYVTKSGYGMDFRYAATTPEFDDNINTQLRAQSVITAGFSRYFKDNDLKLQTAVSSQTTEIGTEDQNTLYGELILQLIF